MLREAGFRSDVPLKVQGGNSELQYVAHIRLRRAVNVNVQKNVKSVVYTYSGSLKSQAASCPC